MPSVEGLPARSAALQMPDAVLRTGATLESTSGRSAGLSPPDRALALAIAGETLRRIPDLDLVGGVVWHVTGPNGSGKTTLLKTLAGLLRPVGLRFVGRKRAAG